jgi:MATE family multidrug resistance protein
MVMGFIGLLVNIPVNYIFIYGHFGMPELGGVGCGVATAAVYWVMFFSMITYVNRARSMRDIRNESRFSKPDMAILTRLVQLGLPIALALFFEVTLFAVVALLVSPLGIVNVAGHQIALNFSSLMFVLPMSLAAAVTIRVGFRLGQGSTLMHKRPHVPGWAWVSVWQPVRHFLPSHCVSKLPCSITTTRRL